MFQTNYLISQIKKNNHQSSANDTADATCRNSTANNFLNTLTAGVTTSFPLQCFCYGSET